MRNVPMFPAPKSTPPKLSHMLAGHAQVKGSYSAYRTKSRVPCDECIAVIHEAKGAGSAPLPARISRRGGGSTLRLCGPHAQLWRVRDGLDKRAAS